MMDSPSFEEMARDYGFDSNDLHNPGFDDSGVGLSQQMDEYAYGNQGIYYGDIGDFLLWLN